ncbi:uncharacterized protein F5891DRAFT_1199917 [Suillus fuscotomentosus]|uniref:Uncharacterized protein n=1 Tax=Suillus fuscotomentosus TaxID=1912939 RepID=A0AAD4HC95_9AGAM|nr:uncharacterized protein F5891DRAFT_1199917 [Suillus fuscotomentosus]KAG1887454.1 hypothetical protein F5891DRAFT_1199917 [Suillus fuscotomentosus]
MSLVSAGFAIGMFDPLAPPSHPLAPLLHLLHHLTPPSHPLTPHSHICHILSDLRHNFTDLHRDLLDLCCILLDLHCLLSHPLTILIAHFVDLAVLFPILLPDFVAQKHKRTPRLVKSQRGGTTSLAA